MCKQPNLNENAEKHHYLNTAVRCGKLHGCVRTLRMLDFRLEVQRFSPWPGHEDCTIGQGIF